MRPLTPVDSITFPIPHLLYQLLETSAGILVPITNEEADGMRFQQDAPAHRKKKLILEKINLVKKGFCAPSGK
jgi:hypothetical protein